MPGSDIAIRIATYNVHNLFAEEDAGGSKTAAAFKALARVLDLMAADVVALQEVGSQRALDQLNASMRVPYPHAVCVPGNSDRGIHLAYLARAPFQWTSHRELVLCDAAGTPVRDFAGPPEEHPEKQPLRLQRDLLQADVHSADGTVPLSVFSVHLKSKTERPWRTLSSDAVRAAEARAIAAQLQRCAREHPQRALMLVGDFNDQWSADALAPLRALNWFDAVAADHAQLQRKGHLPGTYWSKRRARLDYVLLNPIARATLQPGSARTHASTLAQRASDHYPVSVDVTL